MTLNTRGIHQEKPFERGGFQEDRETYIQEIYRMRKQPDGTHEYHPPQLGNKIATVRGPFKVEHTSRVIVILPPERPKTRKCYFEAKGKVIQK